jgi:predicted ArsR family transcriptional regulator
MSGDLNSRLNQVAVLGEPVRRALYRFVAGESEPVTREQAAAGVGVAQHTAKFHLDRLVEEELLGAGYRRPPGRGGPGAGRPAKVYWRSGEDVDVSLPERRYGLAGRLLVKAITEAEQTETSVPAALQSIAADAGRSSGAEVALPQGSEAAPVAVEDALLEALTSDGYEPCAAAAGITLANCPFHALVGEATELVCDMNLAYLSGVLDGVGATSFDAKLDPAEGRCCVRLQRVEGPAQEASRLHAAVSATS